MTRADVIRRQRPSLDCPECGVALIPAHGRGRHDYNGDEIMHADACRCRWCDWWWYDDGTPYACACGASVVVKEDGGSVSASTVEVLS